MARRSIGLTVSSRTLGAEAFSGVSHMADVVNAAATTADTASVVADVAALVADGASPTQGHVNTLATDWALLLADLGAVPANADVVLSFNISTVVTKTVLKRALGRLMAAIDGSDDLTA